MALTPLHRNLSTFRVPKQEAYFLAEDHLLVSLGNEPAHPYCGEPLLVSVGK